MFDNDQGLTEEARSTGWQLKPGHADLLTTHGRQANHDLILKSPIGQARSVILSARDPLTSAKTV